MPNSDSSGALLRRLRFVPAVLLALLVAGGLAACTDDGAGTRSGSASGSGSGTASETADATCETVGDPGSADAEVAVRLDEYVVEPAVDTADAGTVAFAAENDGDEIHEVVVVESDSIEALPEVDGAVDEEQLPDGALIGEIEGFPAGESCAGAFDLVAGDYVLFCNIEDHFGQGMASTFTVN